jgi:hypothetical protein
VGASPSTGSGARRAWSATFGQFPDPLHLKPAQPLCTNSAAYAAFKANICSALDVATGLSVTQPCDALSTGLTFTTRPALLGRVVAVAPPVDLCPPDADPRNDGCDVDTPVPAPVPSPQPERDAAVSDADAAADASRD